MRGGSRIATRHPGFTMRQISGHTPGDDEADPLRTARRINGERVVVLGWGRAILLQLAHPLVAAGVDDHSTFRAGPLAPARRLHATITAMLDLTFGSPQEVARAAAGINRIHDRVHGVLRETAGRFPAGTPYSAHDPDLLAWVQLTLLESLPIAYETFVGPLSSGDKDRWCREARTNMHLLGLTPDRLPESYAELQSALACRIERGEIAVGDTARRLAHDVLHPPLAWLAWPWAGVNRLATVGLLPSHIREQYGFRWSAADRRALTRWAGVIRATWPRAPDAIRRFRPARERRRGPM